MFKKSNLWIISELFPPEETSTAYIMGEIANALSDKYNVKVITGPEIYDSSKTLKKNTEINSSIEIYRVKGVKENKNNKLSRIRKFLLISRQIYNLAKQNIKEDDKVLMVSNPFPLIVLMSRLKHRRNFNLTMLVHDVFPESLFTDISMPKSLYTISQKIFNKAYSSTDRLIVIGRDMKMIMAEKVMAKSNITIIENWADTNNIKYIRNTKHPDEDFIIQYAGNIGKSQGVSNIIDVLHEVNNPKLKMEIWGSGGDLENVKYAIRKYNLQSSIQIKGTYQRSEQNEILSKCDIAVVTLIKGMYGLGTPSKTYNIMAAGKPILYIGEKNTEIWMMVEENHIGYCIEPTDSEGLIHILKNLQREELLDMGYRARKLAENKYSKEIILRKFQEIL